MQSELLYGSDCFEKLLAIISAHQTANVGNTWGLSSHAYISAALHGHLGASLLVLTATEANAEDILSDLNTFTHNRARLFPSDYADERIKTALGEEKIIVSSLKALLEPMPAPFELADKTLKINLGDGLQQGKLAQKINAAGFERVSQVEHHMEYAVRGAIIDVFALTSTAPVRIEFLDNKVESIRFFDPQTQSSTNEVKSIDLNLINGKPESSGASLLDYLPPQTIVVMSEPVEIYEKEKLSPQFASHIQKFKSVLLNTLPVPEDEQGVNFKITSLQRFSGMLVNIPSELEQLASSGKQLYIFCNNDGEKERLAELLTPAKIQNVEYVIGTLSTGFTLEDIGISLVPNSQLFNRYKIRRHIPKQTFARELDSFLELEEGDYIVHIYHGIGKFLGMKKQVKGGVEQEFLVLEYQGGVKLYVPPSNIEQIQKYLGGTEEEPSLDKIGGMAWESAKAKARDATENLAQELLTIQAIRETSGRAVYSPDLDWQREFEAAFPYEETNDQTEITKAIKRDMLSAKSMDRLICGDVGYGKTELVMRAAFRASLSNRQTAVLVPTTILAQQHYYTFRERMADYPVTIEVLSRFKSKAQQRQILEAAADGKVDIVIGTHRLLQDDVRFKNLGLVIIDEEQRFGVEHKERLKRLRATVDVITLTATPIPRTMHMSLLGIKDISILSTPPQDRLAIETQVCLFDENKIRGAVLRELERDGQVFFVHNRVYNIAKIAEELTTIVPEAVIATAHGQMPEDNLEEVMLNFLEKKIDVLVATTIIESGLDIPNANTIIINNADQFGLADLHQLRGRVGRYKNQAYAYFLMPRDRPVLSQAQKLLKVIEEFSQLGAGFKIALRDLEIRGVGNILGKEQHGHIAAIGYELYSRLLKHAVRKRKNEPVEKEFDTNIDIKTSAYIPEDYIPERKMRIEAYRKISRCRSVAELVEIEKWLLDTAGRIPQAVINFFKIIRIKILAKAVGIADISCAPDAIYAKFAFRNNLNGLLKYKRVRMIDEDTLRIALPVNHNVADYLIEIFSNDKL